MNKQKVCQLAVLGSTGSIGTQTLDIVRRNPEKFAVLSLAAGKNAELLLEQISEFRPKFVAVADENAGLRVRQSASSDAAVEIGGEAIDYAASLPDVDTVVAGIIGFAGLKSVLAAIAAGKNIALANKECLVAAGSLVMGALKNSESRMVPVDSEHSSIFQCLAGKKKEDEINRIVLTASGGPFLRTSLEDLKTVSPEAAVKHPKWEMGAKISVDSATLMNKGLEVIEAAKFFELAGDKIDVLVHPESVVHGMVEYKDGTNIAALFNNDMRIPIAFALGQLQACGGAARLSNTGASFLDLAARGELHFEKPDAERFPALALCYQALKESEVMPSILNAANEIAVESFLRHEIRYLDIIRIVSETLLANGPKITLDSIESAVEIDSWARLTASKIRDCCKA